MSITTYGFGSGAITTQGWGSGAAVGALVTQPTLDPSGRTSFLALQGRILIRCKLGDTELVLDLTAYDAALDALESSLAVLEARIRNLETGGYLVDHTRQQVDCKLDEAEFDDTLATWDVSLDTIESSVVEVTASLRNVERQIRIRRRQQRANP